MILISVPRSSRWVAKLWRSACSVTLFLIPAASAASWNRRLSWRVVIGLSGLRPGNSQRSSSGTPASQRVGRAFHHSRNRPSVCGDSITCRSLRPLACSTRMMLCALSICLTFSRTNFARAQAAAIAETEQYADLEAAGDGEQTPHLVRAHHQRDLLRLMDVIDLGGKIQSPQRHAEQEPQPGHDAVAVADAHAGLGQLQLEQADVLSCGRVRGPLQKRGEPLAPADVAPLRTRTELASVHVLDHALAQRANGRRTHGKLLS